MASHDYLRNMCEYVGRRITSCRDCQANKLQQQKTSGLVHSHDDGEEDESNSHGYVSERNDDNTSTAVVRVDFQHEADRQVAGVVNESCTEWGMATTCCTNQASRLGVPFVL